MNRIKYKESVRSSLSGDAGKNYQFIQLDFLPGKSSCPVMVSLTPHLTLFILRAYNGLTLAINQPRPTHTSGFMKYINSIIVGRVIILLENPYISSYKVIVKIDLPIVASWLKV